MYTVYDKQTDKLICTYPALDKTTIASMQTNYVVKKDGVEVPKIEAKKRK